MSDRKGGRERVAGGEQRAEGTALGDLDGFVGYHLRMAQTASFRAFKRRTGEDALRPGWFTVLSLIRTNPGITPMALSRGVGRDKSTLTPLLGHFVRDGLVAREPTEADRRSYRLFLTADGERMLDTLAAHAAEHDRILDDIVGDDKQRLIAILRRLWQSLD